MSWPVGAVLCIAGVLCVLRLGDWQTFMRVAFVIGGLNPLIAQVLALFARYSGLPGMARHHG